MKSPIRRCTTIIEVVMALAVLSISLPPLMVAFANAATQGILPSNATVASFLAVGRMEEIVARRYRGTDGYSAITTANFPAESPVTGYTMFNRTVAVDYVTPTLAAAGSDQGYKKVTVTVSWNSGAQRIRIERVFADF